MSEGALIWYYGLAIGDGCLFGRGRLLEYMYGRLFEEILYGILCVHTLTCDVQELPKKFRLNGHTVGFCPQTEKLEPPNKTSSFHLGVKSESVEIMRRVGGIFLYKFSLSLFLKSTFTLTGKPTKRHKRKNSHPKTTRKRKSSSSTPGSSHEKTKEPRNKKSSKPKDDTITVHIPESQLVHLNSGSTSSSCSSPPGVVVRKQGATSVFVPIYLNSPSKVYRCQRCPAVFKTLDEKEEHNKMHKKEFKCNLCSKSFFTATGYEQHRLNESHSHPCDHCGKVFTSVVQLKKHKTSHSTNRPYGCDQCEKAFCSPANLRSHKRTVHATEKNHKCPECGKAFARKDKMKRHSLIHYPDTRPTFTCPFRSHTGCMKTFYREDKLKRHLFTHSKDKPFKCEQCNKGYARRDNLNDHMRIHTGIYSHVCRICEKGFLGPHKLKKHMRSAHKHVDPDQVQTRPPPPTMVPLDESSPALTAARRERPAPSQANAPAKAGQAGSSTDEEAESELSSPELPSEDENDESFDVSASDSGDEGTSEAVKRGAPVSTTPQPVPPQATATLTHTPTPTHHGPMPRVRPVPRVSAAPQPFIPPPLPPGLHATAELLAFSQELFNVVGRFQSWLFVTFKSENVEDCARVKLLSSKLQLCNITVLLKVGTVLFESQK